MSVKFFTCHANIGHPYIVNNPVLINLSIIFAPQPAASCYTVAKATLVFVRM